MGAVVFQNSETNLIILKLLAIFTFNKNKQTSIKFEPKFVLKLVLMNVRKLWNFLLIIKMFFFFSENIHLQQNSSKRLTENQEKGLNLIFLKQLK